MHSPPEVSINISLFVLVSVKVRFGKIGVNTIVIGTGCITQTYGPEKIADATTEREIIANDCRVSDN